MAELQRRHPGGSSLLDRRRAESSRANRPTSGTLLASDIPVHALNPAAVLGLQRTAGNRAVIALLEGEKSKWGLKIQRSVGWKTDPSKGDIVSKEGYAWNAGQIDVGKIHRIPLDGLHHGLQQESAKRLIPKKDGVDAHWVEESTMIPGLSPETAKGRAIVLVPEALKPNKPIDVLVHLHGYTENTGRPFAGWRALTPNAAETTDKDLHSMRQGIDKKDVAPVRDVALDQAEQQLEESGYSQQVIVLPQGGLRSQFGKAGDYNFDSGAYVTEIVSRLVTEGVWKPPPKDPPEIGRVSMAGHSGAGATLANMARESLRRQAADKRGAPKPARPPKPSASSTLTGDLVLFDAISSSDLGAFEAWARMRLDQDLAALKEMKSDAEKLSYLQTAQKLRGYYSEKGSYAGRYKELDKAIGKWFKNATNAAELGPFVGCLRANFSVVPIPVSHEELMRGVHAGEARAGKGSILDALRALHPPERKTAADCPPAQTAKPAAKPAHKLEKQKSGTEGRSSPVPVRSTPAPVRHGHTTAKRAAPGEERAKQIATAILLAKTGGEGQGKTKEEKKASKEAAEQAVARDIRKGTKKDVDAWFANFEPQATFLGLRIRPSSRGEPPGVHHELAKILTEAEKSLVKAGEKPAAAADRLGVKDIAGLRVPKTPTGETSGASMHCFGLAVDIDHDNNPFIGNVDKPSKKRPEGGASIQIVEHATLLLGGGARDPLRAPPSLEGHKTDSEKDRRARAERAEKQWELLSLDSVLVQHYFSMTSDELDKIVARRLPALKSWQQLQTAEPAQDGKHKKKRKKGPSPPPWVEHVSDPGWWRAQHKRDVKQSMAGDFGHGDTADPTKFGFMTLREEVVKALVQAGLSWGGTYASKKDIMHFDLRTGSIGGRPVV